MTPGARRIVAALVVGAAIAGAGYATHPDATGSAPAASCKRDPLIRGAWFCTFPTGRPSGSGRSARVWVQTWEDGAARVVAIDPDARP